MHEGSFGFFATLVSDVFTTHCPGAEAGNQFTTGDLHQYDRYGGHRPLCHDVPGHAYGGQ